MKEVKAFIRSIKAEAVINALNELGVADITLIDVMGVGHHMVDPSQARYSVEIVNKYSQIAKVEVVCKAVDTEKIVRTIREAAYTGMPGDGMIYVMPVEKAVKIRTGKINRDAVV